LANSCTSAWRVCLSMKARIGAFAPVQRLVEGDLLAA
jgi:hypothetical protein